MDLSRIKPEYTCITDKQIEFLNSVVKSKKVDNQVVKIDVTDLYEKEFANCANENAYCTPYTLLRLFADMIPEMPEKLLYLDIDIMVGDDLSKLYRERYLINDLDCLKSRSIPDLNLSSSNLIYLNIIDFIYFNIVDALNDFLIALI